MAIEKNKTKDEAAIRELIDGFVKAIRAKDIHGVMSVFSPEVVSFDLGPPLQQGGGETFRERWQELFASYQNAIDYEVRDLRPFKSWDEWPDNTKDFFQAQRSPAGEEVILEKNLFIEYLLPLRGISQDALNVYRSYWRIPGPSRMPMLAWSRDLPIEGEPKDVVEVVDSYARWMSTNTIPKLFIDAEPAGFLTKGQREFCRAWPNQQQVTVKGAHFLQEDSPNEVGDAIAQFVAKVLAEQTGREHAKTRKAA